MYRKIVSGLIAIAAQGLAGAAMAQMQPMDSIDPNAMLPALDAEAVAPALAVVTANSLAQVDDAGNEFITAYVSNGLTFEIHFTSCAEPLSQDCKAMYMLATWDAADPSEQASMDEMTSAFQVERPIVSAGVLPDGKPYVLRFVIADYGIQQGNVLSEFSNFIQNATDFHNRLGTDLPENTEE